MDGRSTRTAADTERSSRASGTSARQAPRRDATGEGEDRFRHAYSKDRAQLLRRLSRIEGQVRGIGRMIERDEYCIDILQQTAALRAAIDSLGLLVMEDHVVGCLQTAARTGDAEAYTEELMDVVRRTLGRPVRGSRSTTAD
jgi:DNA-binding FrmR family transcriptional regulator